MGKRTRGKKRGRKGRSKRQTQRIPKRNLSSLFDFTASDVSLVKCLKRDFLSKKPSKTKKKKR